MRFFKKPHVRNPKTLGVVSGQTWSFEKKAYLINIQGLEKKPINISPLNISILGHSVYKIPAPRPSAVPLRLVPLGDLQTWLVSLRNTNSQAFGRRLISLGVLQTWPVSLQNTNSQAFGRRLVPFGDLHTWSFYTFRRCYVTYSIVVLSSARKYFEKTVIFRFFSYFQPTWWRLCITNLYQNVTLTYRLHHM